MAVPPTRPGCGTCSEREYAYCETRVLADHCCCERRFVREPFPWLPHTCYVGARRCRPLAHDCAQYARLRDCCCHRKLAERCKHRRHCRRGIILASFVCSRKDAVH